MDEKADTTKWLLPWFLMQDSPFIVLYQRTYTNQQLRMEGDPPTQVTRTDGSTGHFEAIVRRTRSAAGVLEYSGVFRPGGDTATEYGVIRLIADRLMAERNSEKASMEMAVYHDAKSSRTKYALLDAVGVRVPGRNARKGDGPNSLPGVVIGIYRQEAGACTARVVHQLYTVWCEYGVLSQMMKVDKLVTLTINGYPQLLHFRDETLTAAERLPEGSPGHQQPLTGTAAGIPKITVEAAWKAHLRRRRQRTEDQSRQRTVSTRQAADAADTAIAPTLSMFTTHLYTNLCESSRKADQHRNRRYVRAFPASSPCRIAVPLTPQSHSILSSCPSQALGCFPSWDRTPVARVKPHSIAMALPLCTAVATAPRR